jgi:hypothetical protein
MGLVAETAIPLEYQNGLSLRRAFTRERYATRNTRVSFTEIHQGSRDPRDLSADGAGFVFCWQGRPQLLVGHANKEQQLIQVTSERMTIAIPRYVLYPKNILYNDICTSFDEANIPHGTNTRASSPSPSSSGHPGIDRTTGDDAYRKVCAKLESGVLLGIGFVLERACGPECKNCSGLPFYRECRYFEFRPHHKVQTATYSTMNKSEVSLLLMKLQILDDKSLN